MLSANSVGLHSRPSNLKIETLMEGHKRVDTTIKLLYIQGGSAEVSVTDGSGKTCKNGWDYSALHT